MSDYGGLGDRGVSYSKVPPVVTAQTFFCDVSFVQPFT